MTRTTDSPLGIHVQHRPEPICQRPLVRVDVLKQKHILSLHSGYIVGMSELLDVFRDHVGIGFGFDSRFRTRKDRLAEKIMR